MLSVFFDLQFLITPLLPSNISKGDLAIKPILLLSTGGLFLQILGYCIFVRFIGLYVCIVKMKFHQDLTTQLNKFVVGHTTMFCQASIDIHVHIMC